MTATVRTIRVEILKPLDRDWGTFGRQLFTLRNLAHKCLQGALLNISRYDSPRVETPLNTKTGKPYNPQTLAYHGAKDVLDAYNEWARAFVPKKEEPQPTEAYVPSSVLTSWANEAHTRWRTWCKGGRTTQLPSFCQGAAILLKEVTLQRNTQGTLTARLKVDHQWDTVAITPGQGGNWAVVEEMAKGTREVLAARLTYDARARKKTGGKGKWYLSLVYPAPAREPTPGNTWLVVHRGTRNLFTLLSTGGQPWKRIPGHSLAHQKRCLLARMAEIRQSINAGEIGSGARGRGKRVRYRAYHKLEDTLERTLRTRIQQIAARVTALAHLWGCTGLIVEDYGGIDPSTLTAGQRKALTLLPAGFAKDALLEAAAKEGLQVRVVPARNISSTCPACGHTEASNHRVRTGVFCCRRCQWKRDADYVAAYHMSQAGLLPTEPNPVKKRLEESIRLRHNETR